MEQVSAKMFANAGNKNPKKTQKCSVTKKSILSIDAADEEMVWFWIQTLDVGEQSKVGQVQLCFSKEHFRKSILFHFKDFNDFILFYVFLVDIEPTIHHKIFYF